jgi:hypothetical protein
VRNLKILIAKTVRKKKKTFCSTNKKSCFSKQQSYLFSGEKKKHFWLLMGNEL